MPDWKLDVGKVRWVGWCEGASFLLLMGVAMPLKYLAGLPLMVKWVGWLHGLLFVGLMVVILLAWLGARISGWRAVLTFLASLFPGGPFVIDRWLAEDEQRERAALRGSD